MTRLLEWRGARVQATVARGLENQALVRFSQVRIATARLIAATLVAARYVDAMTQRSGELVRQLIAGAAAQSELLELLLVVVLGDAALSLVFADELQHVVPVVLEGQRDNDPERATMARHAAALLTQYSLSDAQLDALLAAMHAQVANTGDGAAWQSRRVALPMLQLLAFRLRFDGGAQVNARVLEIGKLALLDPRIEVRESAEGLIASLLRGQVPPFDAAQLRAEFVAQARSKDATRQHAGVLGLAALMASEPYNVPTWLLDVAQALAQHSSVSSRVCRAAQAFFRTRGRAIDELGVTASGAESEAELAAANERLVRVSSQLRELSATQTHYA